MKRCQGVRAGGVWLSGYQGGDPDLPLPRHNHLSHSVRDSHLCAVGL